MTTATKLPLTAEEFAGLPEGDGKLELVDGRVVDMAPASNRHSLVQGRLLRRLAAHLEAHGLGEALPELGCRLDPRTVLVPDVAWVPAARLAASLAAGEPFLTGAPDLAVEVVSPDDSLAALTRKAQRYLDAGSRLVWVVDPQRRRATVHRPDGTTTMIPTEGALPGEDVLPGLEIPLATLFV